MTYNRNLYFFFRAIVLALCAIGLSHWLSIGAYGQIPPPVQTENISPPLPQPKTVFLDIAKKTNDQYLAKNLPPDYEKLFTELQSQFSTSWKFKHTKEEKKLLLDGINQIFKYPNSNQGLKEFFDLSLDFDNLTDRDIKKVNGAGVAKAITWNRKENKWTAFLSLLYVAMGITSPSELSAQYGVNETGDPANRVQSFTQANKEAKKWINEKGYQSESGGPFPIDGLLDSEVIAFLIREFVKTEPPKKVVKAPKPASSPEEEIKPVPTPPRFIADPPEFVCFKGQKFPTNVEELKSQINSTVVNIMLEEKNREKGNAQLGVIDQLTRKLNSCLPPIYKTVLDNEVAYQQALSQPDKDELSLKKILNQLGNKRTEAELIMDGFVANMTILESLSLNLSDKKILNKLSIELDKTKVIVLKASEGMREVMQKISEISKKQKGLLPQLVRESYEVTDEERFRYDFSFLLENLGVIQVFLETIEEKITSLDDLEQKKLRDQESWLEKFYASKGFRINYSLSDSLNSALKTKGGSLSKATLEGFLGTKYKKSEDFEWDFYLTLEALSGFNVISPGFELGGKWLYKDTWVFGADMDWKVYYRISSFSLTKNNVQGETNGSSRRVDTTLSVSQKKMGTRFIFDTWKNSFFEISISYDHLDISGDLEVNDTDADAGITAGDLFSASGSVKALGIGVALGLVF